MSSKPLSFQEIITKLLTYWQEQGCLMRQPYNIQVGAGTMNPATALRVLGPEPWNVVYVEPSIRPDDGRFGDNPNRMQMFHQLQVILKPDPGNPQQLYLDSLEAIGIDPREHDIRFVEDNWESPALGAWGLGWEVWLDGQEITQFTYFQQAGGFNLDPVSVEITYGLDRIALALQGVNSVWEIDYGNEISFGGMLLQNEIEHCRYYFDIADVDGLKQVYDVYESEAKRCLEAGLVLPAHDYNLKCSHLFNVLDTRGAIGVTERANYFRRMRNVSIAISKLFVAERERLEHPLLVATTPPSPQLEKVYQFTQMENPHTFMLEIGSEELPVDDLTNAIAQLEKAVPALLNDLRLGYEAIKVYGTPRRLAVVVDKLHGRQTDLESVAKGPPAERAFDADGNPTKAAIGFARGKGVDVADLQIVEEKGKRYVTAVIAEEGRAAVLILADALPALIDGLKFKRSMRWNDSGATYSRPIRWLVALYGPDIVHFEYAGLHSGRMSRGLRPFGSLLFSINDGDDYLAKVTREGIILDPVVRRQQIKAAATVLAAKKSGRIPDDAALLSEISNLVERPTAFVGTFEERFLSLPPEALVAVMRKHQRYFPVYDDNGALKPYFIAIRNGDDRHLDMVTYGNEQVILARFADAEFFYNNDAKRPLIDFLPELDKLTFQFKLGSMLDKTRRLEKLTPIVADMLGLDKDETSTACRAATLAKADLATSLVVEMTSLQGMMGSHYATLSGESEAVAAAIGEQYNAVSQTKAGMAVAIADRLDSLAGLFAAGLAPKGSNDPFALRRAALHIIENLIANEQPFDLQTAVSAAMTLQPIENADAVAGVMAFINGRVAALFRDKAIPASVTKAVLAEQASNPYAAEQTAVSLTTLTQAADWDSVLDGYARCVRITRKENEQYALTPAAFTLDEEKQLFTAYEDAKAMADGTVDGLEAGLRLMLPAITAFFDGVMVMDKETAVRQNRLALLQHIAALTNGIADLSELEGF